MPPELSSTRSYGVVNSMPMSSTTASQNHSMSSTERRRNSSIEPMPWPRMKRVTFALSTYSALGRQATSAIGASILEWRPPWT
jgi:hypothetical protein